MIRRTINLSLVALLVVAGTSGPLAAQGPAEWAKTNMQSLVELYVWLHKNPELSFKEEKTAARMASELEAAGCEVSRSIGGHGVVGVLRNGEGPVILVRADMDGLPITERTGRPYASNVTVTDDTGASVGVMHACGHDIHMTCLIGTARFLAENKSLWKGTLLFVGQPAEERGSGANAMIDAGLFEKFPKPQAALALHVSPEIPAGKIGTAEGFMMANVDSVDIRFKGKGGHGAYPQQTIDPIVIAARFVLDVQTLASREIDPAEAVVVTVGAIRGGTKHNIIPDECDLQLTVRSYSDEVRNRLLEGIRRKAVACAASAGASEPEIKVSEGTPSLFNDIEMTARLTASLKKSLGDDRVTTAVPVMGGEDFSQFGRRGEIPVMLFWLGTVEQERLNRYTNMQLPPPGLHSAEYYPDPELSLETGIAAMCHAVMELAR